MVSDIYKLLSIFLAMIKQMEEMLHAKWGLMCRDVCNYQIVQKQKYIWRKYLHFKRYTVVFPIRNKIAILNCSLLIDIILLLNWVAPYQPTCMTVEVHGMRWSLKGRQDGSSYCVGARRVWVRVTHACACTHVHICVKIVYNLKVFFWKKLSIYFCNSSWV